MQTRFRLACVENGTEYLIQVLAPAKSDGAADLPAILFMDGDDQFSFAVSAYEKLRKADAIPPLLLVGVGYGASYREPGNRRGRDYTPTPHSDEPSSGGSDVFLRFLNERLWPELERLYPIHRDVRGIAGHSLGSLLALYALCSEPPFYTHVLASAPSIWWDNRSVLRIADERYTRSSRLPAHLFLSVGEKDSASMTGDLVLLEQQLKRNAFDGLQTTIVRFPERDHYNVIGDAFTAGLVALFGVKNAPIDPHSRSAR